MMSRCEGSFGCIEMVDLAVRRAAEYAYAGSLPAGIFFHPEILIESIVVAGDKPDLVPATTAAPLPEGSQVDFGNQREISFIGDVRGDCGVPVGPHIAHVAGELVVRRPHHVIDDQAVLSGREKLGEADVTEVRGRFVANI